MFGRLKQWWHKRRKHRAPKVPATADEFAKLLASSGIATNHDAASWLELFRTQRRSMGVAKNGVEEFCGFLISEGHVTGWQCEKLKAGKWKGFFFEDRYLLLEQVGKGGDDTESYYSSYRARDAKTNGLACLVIRPLNYTDGRFEYRAYPYM